MKYRQDGAEQVLLCPCLLYTSGSDGEQHIAVADCHVCCIGTMHAEVSDIKRMVSRNGTFAPVSYTHLQTVKWMTLSTRLSDVEIRCIFFRITLP